MVFLLLSPNSKVFFFFPDGIRLQIYPFGNNLKKKKIGKFLGDPGQEVQ